MDITSPSLTFPTDLSAISSDWHTAGPVEISRKGDSLVINPAMVDSPTLVWSRERIPSDDFEVAIVLGAILPTEDVNTMFDYDGVGFWYCHEGPEGTKKVTVRNEKRKDKRKPKKARFGLFGYKDEFDGLGAFLFFDGGSPMLTMLTNAPPEAKAREDATGATEGIGLYDAFYSNKMKGEIKIKIRIQPDKATVDVHGDKLEVQGKFKAGGHIGLTAVSASYQKDETLVPTLVEIKDLKIRSFVPLVELPAPATPPQTPAQDNAKEDHESVRELSSSALEKNAVEESPGSQDAHQPDDRLEHPAVSEKASGPRVESGLQREFRKMQARAQAQAQQLSVLHKEVLALRAEL